MAKPNLDAFRRAFPTYEAAKHRHDELMQRLAVTSAAVRAFPRNGLMGLPTEDVRLAPAFRSAKAAYDRASEAARDFNAGFVPLYGKQYAGDLRSRRATGSATGGAS